LSLPIELTLGTTLSLTYYAEVLFLEHNALKGSFPSEIAKLAKLSESSAFMICRFVFIAHYLSNSVLWWFCEANLWAQYNFLTGTIPSNIREITKLSECCGVTFCLLSKPPAGPAHSICALYIFQKYCFFMIANLLAAFLALTSLLSATSRAARRPTLLAARYERRHKEASPAVRERGLW